MKSKTQVCLRAIARNSRLWCPSAHFPRHRHQHHEQQQRPQHHRLSHV